MSWKHKGPPSHGGPIPKAEPPQRFLASGRSGVGVGGLVYPPNAPSPPFYAYGWLSGHPRARHRAEGFRKEQGDRPAGRLLRGLTREDRYPGFHQLTVTSSP